MAGLSRSSKLLRLMVITVLGIVSFLTTARTPAWATDVTDINGVYMAENATLSCPNANDTSPCVASLPSVPNGHYLTVSHVSCILAQIGNPVTFSLMLPAVGGTQDTFLTIGTPTFFDGTSYYQGTFSVLAVYASGKTPQVEMGVFVVSSSSVSVRLQCTIAGNLHKNPS
jgi:hypothetical protein